MDDIHNIIDKLKTCHYADKHQLVRLLETCNPTELFDAANSVRQKFVGDEVHLRGLIELTNYCRNSCLYCGLRAGNTALKRYRMSVEQVVDTAKNAVQLGLKTIVLQGGEDSAYSLKDICSMISQIKKMDVAVTLSLGEHPTVWYKEMKSAGADRYLLRIETTNRQLYHNMHPGMSFDNRLRCLYDLKCLGFETGTGCLIGLPGQTYDMLAEDLMFFKQLDADMIGLGPFVPCPDTPLGSVCSGSIDVTLRMIALVRLMLPDINIPATTALGTVAEHGYKRGLECGANVIMPNMGMIEYKKLYTLYPGKMVKSPKQHLQTAKDIIASLNRKVGRGKGFRNNRIS